MVQLFWPLVSGSDCVNDFKSLDEYLKLEEEKEQLLIRGEQLLSPEFCYLQIFMKVLFSIYILNLCPSKSCILAMHILM